MKAIVIKIIVIYFIGLYSANPINFKSMEDNECYLAKKQEINDAGGYRETKIFKVAVLRELAKLLCMTPEARKEIGDSMVASGSAEDEIKDNLACYKAALKKVKPESSFGEENDCPNEKVKEIIDTMTAEYNSEIDDSDASEQDNAQVCTSKVMLPKNLFFHIELGEKILINSDFDEERKREEKGKLFEETLAFHENMYNCFLNELKNQNE